MPKVQKLRTIPSVCRLSWLCASACVRHLNELAKYAHPARRRNARSHKLLVANKQGICHLNLIRCDQPASPGVICEFVKARTREQFHHWLGSALRKDSP